MLLQVLSLFCEWNEKQETATHLFRSGKFEPDLQVFSFFISSTPAVKSKMFWQLFKLRGSTLKKCRCCFHCKSIPSSVLVFPYVTRCNAHIGW